MQDNDPYNHLGRLVRAFRLRNHWSTETLAREAHYSSVPLLESGERELNAGRAKNVADALGLDDRERAALYLAAGLKGNRYIKQWVEGDAPKREPYMQVDLRAYVAMIDAAHGRPEQPQIVASAQRPIPDGSSTQPPSRITPARMVATRARWRGAARAYQQSKQDEPQGR